MKAQISLALEHDATIVDIDALDSDSVVRPDDPDEWIGFCGFIRRPKIEGDGDTVED